MEHRLLPYKHCECYVVCMAAPNLLKKPECISHKQTPDRPCSAAFVDTMASQLLTVMAIYVHQGRGECHVRVGARDLFIKHESWIVDICAHERITDKRLTPPTWAKRRSTLMLMLLVEKSV